MTVKRGLLLRRIKIPQSRFPRMAKEYAVREEHKMRNFQV
jgi:hypothetical protein